MPVTTVISNPVYNRDTHREFPVEVKEIEWRESDHKCRICGVNCSSDTLQYAHIYSVSLNPTWMRSETDIIKWKDDNYVKSSDNCLLLCKQHHNQCDSPNGLKVCTVSYLQSLKTHDTCTALYAGIPQKVNSGATGVGNRCKNVRMKNSLRCFIHSNGGVESQLQVEHWTRMETLPMLKSLGQITTKITKTQNASGKSTVRKTTKASLKSFKVVKTQHDDLSPLEKDQLEWLNSIDTKDLK